MVPALRHLVFHLDQIVALVKATDQMREPRRRPHQFHDAAAIEHLRHTMDPVSVQHLLGHSNCWLLLHAASASAPPVYAS